MTQINLLLIELIVCVASGLAVISGYGFVLFCGPLLSIIYDPTRVVLMSLIMGTVLLGGLLAMSENRRFVNYHLALSLSFFSILGMPIGIWLLPLLNEGLFRLIVGLLTLLFVISRFFGSKALMPKFGLSILLAGFLGGIFSTSTGLSSLPIIWFFSSQDLNPLEYRATIAAYVFLNGVISIIALAIKGAFGTFNFRNLVSLSPALIIGLVVGTLITRKLSKNQLERGSLIYLGVIGLVTALSIKL